ncbi:MBL fold metallo-hydrolase [Rhodocytophaga aerolata]|uniref:MBL fold metallo-hydrolase n=1 Tax=Rhodocytophaga aerolata TaxID=455078 RepID=A0ABT8R2J7_9BACT|nr:MBL fold metallo-hydrolase [Rhodocytophaga aerolata]MDO1445584.1 MBL fold metallo-hydrolase [Rhodocytophaga aerolata]
MNTRFFLLTLCVLVVVFFTNTASTPPARTLDVYWVDVEGGAATLLVTPAGESVLIDTGNPGGRDAQRIYQVATEVAGLKQIDHLIVTHFHIDHYGGAAELAKKMPIKRIYDKGIPQTLREDAEFASRIAPYRQIQAERITLKPGTQIKLKALPKRVAKLALWCLGLDQKFADKADPQANTANCDAATDKPVDTSDNANSTVFMMEFGSFRFFDGGDLTWNVEKTLVCPDNLPGEVDVFQVNHHGLDQSNNPVLVKALLPTVAVINNGTRKGCGPDTFTALQNTPSIQAIYQLHKNLREDGATINTQPEKIANMEENCAANYVKLSVEADGEKYTLSIPATKHQQVFTTKK